MDLRLSNLGCPRLVVRFSLLLLELAFEAFDFDVSRFGIGGALFLLLFERFFQARSALLRILKLPLQRRLSFGCVGKFAVSLGDRVFVLGDLALKFLGVLRRVRACLVEFGVELPDAVFARGERFSDLVEVGGQTCVVPVERGDVFFGVLKFELSLFDAGLGVLQLHTEVGGLPLAVGQFAAQLFDL